MSVAAAAIVLVIAFAFFAFGWIGGGDAKLVAATTLWVGFGLMLPYLIYAALLGGGLTLLILAVRRYPLPALLARQQAGSTGCTTPNRACPTASRSRSPALLVYPETAIFSAFRRLSSQSATGTRFG